MKNFDYVKREEYMPVKKGLIELIKKVQDEVSDKFTFRYDFIGITRYHDSITATQGLTLINQLNALINVVTAGDGSQNSSYAEVITILQEADKSLTDPTKLWSMYDSSLRDITWDSNNNWNREHVWPQSLLGGGSTSGRTVLTDPHNLRAITPSTNTSRLNKYFDNLTSSVSYFPGDAHKGDVARILLYMVVRYNNLSLVDGKPNVYQMSRISLLFAWHQEDQVDDFEIRRNEVIYQHQGNRNPFIDNPTWFETVWQYYMQQVGLQVKALEMQIYTLESMYIIQTQYVSLEEKFIH